MCELLTLCHSIDNIVNELDILLVEADEVSEHENLSANRIQRLFRGWTARVGIYHKNLAALVIQRVFRGHSSRQYCRRKIRDKMEMRKYAAFQYFALQLQKSFRGYYSRKYRQDHASRKAYLNKVEQTGQEVRQRMVQYAKEQAEMEESNSRQQREKEFKELTENLHHLVSTKQIRGVYNPYASLLEVPTVKDVPVEDYLRGAVKDLLRTRGVTKKGLTRDLNGTLKVPMKGMKHRLSLQASVPYDVLEKERIRQRIRHEILTRDKEGAFFAGGKTKLLEKPTTPLCNDDPYMDQWANPLLMRGVPPSQTYMRERALSRSTYPEFQPPPEQPFYLTASGNKNPVLPNNTFDTIADAEESGGVTRRHLATTTRLGLPERCDNRVNGGELPAPPNKTAALMPTKRTLRAHKMMTKKLSSTAPLPRSSSIPTAPIDGDSSDDEY